MIRQLIQDKHAILDYIAKRTKNMALLGTATPRNPDFVELMALQTHHLNQIDTLLKAANANPHLW